MSFPSDENVIVGLDHADDAGVYKVSEDLALIQTVDFFTPIVDDPYDFGQIAAANALSDVYAMGGTPKTAMNLVAFPIKELDVKILRSIIQGGIDKVKEANAVLLGGHSLEDKELKYGLSVTGFVHPDKVLTKKGLLPGDRLILTKPLGTGIVNTAIKAGLASTDCIKAATALMAKLNKEAAAVMTRYPVHACTDITGFGLIGHLAEMIQFSGCGAVLFEKNLPIIKEAVEFANIGFVPEGAYKNRKFRECMVEVSAGINPVTMDILFDPQTSGGLLMSVAPEAAGDLIAELRDHNSPDAVLIGDVTDIPVGKIQVQ